jgi:succinate dehydrogenase assembly factor 2
MGQAGESVPTLSASEQALLRIAKPKEEAIYQRHIQMPRLDQIPAASFGPELNDNNRNETDAREQLELEIRRKRLIYRSKQRGWLEVDLLLGTWAAKYVPTLAVAELDEYEDFVNRETIDIYDIITLKVEIDNSSGSLLPATNATTTTTSMAARIQQWAKESPLGKADPAMYAATKASAKLI